MQYMGTVFKYYVSITSMFKYIDGGDSIIKGSVKKILFIYSFFERIFYHESGWK